MGKVLLRHWVVRVFLLTIVPLLLIMSFIQLYTMSMLTSIAYERAGQTLDIYIAQIEKDIMNMETFLHSLYLNNIDLSNLALTNDENELYFAQRELTNELSKGMVLHSSFDGLFIWVIKDNSTIYLPSSNSESIKYQSMNVRQYITDNVENLNTKAWELIELDNDDYLFRIIKNGSIYCGCWLRIDQIGGIIKDFSKDANTQIVISYEEELLAISSDIDMHSIEIDNTENMQKNLWSNYIVTSKDIPFTGLKLSVIQDTEIVLGSIIWVRQILAILYFLTIILIPMFIVYLRIKIYKPVKTLCSELETVKLQNNPLPDNSFSEFFMIHDGMTNLKSQINMLNIEAYEQELRTQKIHMQYLTAQVKPHFYLNALNVIYSLSLINKNELIQTITMSLVRYLRYSFQNLDAHVSLKQELDHVSDYIEIQSVRYPEKIKLETNIEQALFNAETLPFIIQPFVENSIKHSISASESNEIRIEAKHKNAAYMQIMISDTGQGYPLNIIKGMNSDSYKEFTDHIGIINVKERLKLAYGEDAVLTLGNDINGGAKTEMIIPINNKDVINEYD